MLSAIALTLGGCATMAPRSDAPAPLTAGGPAARGPHDDAGAVSPAPAWYAEAPAPVRRYAALNRTLGDALRGARTCDAVARALDAWTRAHGDAFRAAVAGMDAWEGTVERSEARRYHERISRDIDARVQAGVRCDGHADAHAAFDRFFDTVGFSGGG